MSKPQTFEERFPIHAKIEEQFVARDVLLNFFDWAQSSGALGVPDEGMSQIFADYFEVDLEAFEAEQRKMHTDVRRGWR